MSGLLYYRKFMMLVSKAAIVLWHVHHVMVMGEVIYKMKFTTDQQKVIDAKKCDLLVSAAAGSGKTAVLVERIIKMITDGDDPADIDQILVVTFTNAAAAQMREKISRAVSLRLQEDPANEHLQRQAALVHHAQITTIDKFCVSVIRNHFQDIDLDPAFRIAEEGELKLLKNDVENKVLEEYYASGDADFLNMCDTLSPGNSDAGVIAAVESLCGTADSYPWPRTWLTEHAEDYSFVTDGDSENARITENTENTKNTENTENTESIENTDCTENAESKTGICDTSWWKLGKTYITGMLAQAVSMCREESELCDMPGGPEHYSDNINEDYDRISHAYDVMMKCDDYDTIRNTIQGIPMSTLSRKRPKDVDP